MMKFLPNLSLSLLLASAAMAVHAAPATPAPMQAAPSQAPVSAVEDDSAVEASWRVAAHQVTALMREVERLREFRMRLEDRLRDISKAVELLTAAYYSAMTGEAVALPLGPGHPFYGGWLDAMKEAALG